MYIEQSRLINLLCTSNKKWLLENTEFRLEKTKKYYRCTKLTNYPYNTYRTANEAVEAARNGTWQDD